MTYITGIRLTNFYRYRGSSEIELEAKAYAIVAERDGNPEISNWCGKTSLAIAIRFALTGWHSKRTEDEWITDGEKDGGVDLELSDGTFISRTRARGKSTQLRVVYRPTVVFATNGEHEHALQHPLELEAHGADAQEVLDRLLGFSDEDAAATWWIGQGKMARLVSMQGEKLTEIVNGWLALGPLDAAANHVLGKLRRYELEASRLQGSIEAQSGCLKAVSDLEATYPALVNEVTRLESVVQSLGGSKAIDNYRAWERDAHAHERWVSLNEARKAETLVAPAPDPKAMDRAGEKAADLRSKTDAAAAEVRTKRLLASGEFDGKCPVGGIQCPAKDQLNKSAAANKRMLDQVTRTHAQLDQERADAAVALRSLTDRKNLADKAIQRIAFLDQGIADEAAAHERFLASQEPPSPAQVQTALLELERARSAVLAHDRAIEKERAGAQSVGDAESKLAGVRAFVQAHREALQIFGRNGAPRRIAESTLGQVEARTNAALARCGIDLSVTIRWAREGKVLAKACYSCGAAFPASQKVKACAECGAERGPQLDEKLAIDCSDTSGGALDLAGALFQLSVGRWLRERRGYGWAVAVLDEPLAALDPFNRRAFSTKLAGALRTEFGLEQAFLVSHDSGTLDAMPGRIRVIARKDGSTAIVES